MTKPWLVSALALVAVGFAGAPVWGQGDEDEDEEDDDRRDRGSRDDEDEDDDGGGGMRANRGGSGDEEDDEDKDDGKARANGKGRQADDADDEDDAEADDREEITHESDHTRPGGGGPTDTDSANAFEQSRFFIDKLDTKDTANHTLFQGSLTSSNFYYRESGGALQGGAAAAVNSNSQFSRMFTDFRTQLDAIHIAGGRWDFRFDARARAMNDPPRATTISGQGFDYPTRVQGGLLGRNELELKEMWLVRGGKRADLFFGRQFITDLGAIKVDGLRMDYAYTNTFTVLGFAGTYPMRGSRSVGTDYLVGKDEAGNRVGRVIPFTAGGGAAYRTERMYGAFGGVVIVPLKGGEPPRLYGTSNGYWRQGTTIDLYHFAIIDLFGPNGFALTNLSGGVNFKPVPRIRVTGSLNRVDTETLNTTAQAFLQEPDPLTPGLVRNDIQVQRIASDQVRGSLSVALGGLQQIEATTALALRRRPKIDLYDGINGDPVQSLPASQSVEVFFSLLHRKLFKDLRIGADYSRIFGFGGGGIYARSASASMRLFGSREIGGGRGELEVDLGYTSSKDDTMGAVCSPGDISTCYGASAVRLIELGGTMYYRLRKDIFAVAMLNIGSYKQQTTGQPPDGAVLSTSGYLRLGYRF